MSTPPDKRLSPLINLLTLICIFAFTAGGQIVALARSFVYCCLKIKGRKFEVLPLEVRVRWAFVKSHAELIKFSVTDFN